MGADVIPLVFPETNKRVRVLIIDGAPWWVARDVCNVLEMERPDAALRGLDDDEKGAHSVSTPGGDQRMSVISESGLYSMILRSRKAEARAFKKWITSEVLPEIVLPLTAVWVAPPTITTPSWLETRVDPDWSVPM